MKSSAPHRRRHITPIKESDSFSFLLRTKTWSQSYFFIFASFLFFLKLFFFLFPANSAPRMLNPDLK